MYGRRLADGPVGGRRVLIRLAVRWFFCGDPVCPLVTFVEQIGWLTLRCARRAPLGRTLTDRDGLAGRAQGAARRRGGPGRRAVPVCCGGHGAARPEPGPVKVLGGMTSRSAPAWTTAPCWSTPNRPARRSAGRPRGGTLADWLPRQLRHRPGLRGAWTRSPPGWRA
ncbi:MAG: hypothetical protein ACM3ML_15020 [Micromonosporaceae bacterium]